MPDKLAMADGERCQPRGHTFDALLIGGDGGAFDTDVVLLDGQSRVDGDLVIGLVTVRQAQVIVQALHLWEGSPEVT